MDIARLVVGAVVLVALAVFATMAFFAHERERIKRARKLLDVEWRTLYATQAIDNMFHAIRDELRKNG